MNRIIRKIVGVITSPSGCKVCHRPWDLCKAHDTPLAQRHPEESCFVLCEPCFNELNPIQRLPYYHELFARWLECDGLSDAYWFRKGLDWEDRPHKHTAKDWEMLRDSVLAGL